MTPADIITSIRSSLNQSQRAFAATTGLHQPNIARAEKHGWAVTTTTLDQILRTTGHQIIAIAYQGTTAAETAIRVRHALTRSTSDPFRQVIQLADDLQRVSGAERLGPVLTPPTPTTSAQYDNLIAGVVETRLDADQLPHPAWLAAIEPLNDEWQVDHDDPDHAQLRASTPPRLAARGVLLSAAELVSV